MKISVILATYNEEKNIKDCLESVKELADEIVIVDGTSTDKTVEIASHYTKKIFIRENPLMFHKNKQYAIEKATGDWILYLDADERVSTSLKKEIKSAIRNPKSEINGFWIPRKNIIFGKWIRYTGWWPDYQLRLFRRGKAFLPCKSLHEQPQLTGKAGYLKNPLVHYNYQTVSQFVQKLNKLYTENDKNIFLSEGKKFNWQDVIHFPSNEFLKRFFLEEGYKDGFHGLVLSIFQAFSSFVTFAKIWETRGFPEMESDDFLSEIEKEAKKISREFKYWLTTAKLSQTKNFFKKFYYRLKRKLIL
jgi:glycosyltransferase involved in cell wall biosynthesis